MIDRSADSYSIYSNAHKTLKFKCEVLSKNQKQFLKTISHEEY